jgi:hypothetical protein
VDRVDALLFQPVDDLDDRDALGAGPGRHGNGVGHVVDVAVGDRDVGWIHVLGGDDGGRVVRLQERVDQDPRIAIAQF